MTGCGAGRGYGICRGPSSPSLTSGRVEGLPSTPIHGRLPLVCAVLLCVLCVQGPCSSKCTCSAGKGLCSALDSPSALQALIYMARVAMLHGKDQQLKDLASQLIVSLTWQTGEFRTILQNDYSIIV